MSSTLMKILHVLFVLVFLPVSLLPVDFSAVKVEIEKSNPRELLFGLNTSLMAPRYKNEGFKPVYGVLGASINLRVGDLGGMVLNVDRLALLNQRAFDTQTSWNPELYETRISIGIQHIMYNETGRGILELKHQLRPETGFIFSVGGEREISKNLRYRILFNFFPHWNIFELFFADYIRTDWSVTLGMYYNL